MPLMCPRVDAMGRWTATVRMVTMMMDGGDDLTTKLLNERDRMTV